MVIGGSLMVSFTNITNVSKAQISGNGKPLSQISTTTVSVPAKPTFGVYSNEPSGLIIIVPLLGSVIGITSMVKAVLSGSTSLVKKLPETGLSTVVVTVSFSIIGTSFTGVIVMINVSNPQIGGRGVPLSHTFTTIVSLPKKFSFGV